MGAFVRYGIMLLAVVGIALIVVVTGVRYEGRKFVYEGSSFTIACTRSVFGAPKWTKDGKPVIPSDDNNFTISAEELGTNELLMLLHVEYADLSHRGEYKCDSLIPIAHKLEVVTTPETDELYTVPRVSLQKNQTLELYCEVMDNSIFKINWYKDGHRLLDGDNERMIMEGRTLLILDAEESDAGDYKCAVEVTGLSYPTAHHLDYTIQVTYPAHVEKFPSQLRPIFGRNFSVECKVRGYPVPRISWFIDDTASDFYEMNDTRIRVVDNAEGLPNSVLFIQDVTYDDEYYVMCYAENKEGFSENSVALYVRGNMIDTNEEFPGKGIILNIGVDLVLQCNTTDDPSLDVMWYKNGNTLNMTDPRIYIENSNNSLVIHKSTEADTGSYMCVVTNTQKLINATISVKSRIRLHPFENPRNVVQGLNIVLTCNVTQGIPLPTLQWLKDGEPMNLSDSRILAEKDARGIANAKVVIREADFDDRAEYMCVATNDVGSLNITTLIRIKDKYAALWPFLGICAEVAVLCTIIFVYEKKRQKPDFDESEADHTTENKTVSDNEDKSQDIRQRK